MNPVSTLEWPYHACSVPDLDGLVTGGHDGRVVRAERDGSNVRSVAGVIEAPKLFWLGTFLVQIESELFNLKVNQV